MNTVGTGLVRVEVEDRPIYASFETFGGEIAGFSIPDGSVLRENERRVLSTVD